MKPTGASDGGLRAGADGVGRIGGGRGTPLHSPPLAELVELLGPDRVLTRPVDKLTYSYDAYLDEAIPLAIVFPTSSQETARVVDIARRHRVPLVARGRGTNLSGGTVPARGAVVVELSAMDRILHVDLEERTAVVEAGVYNTDVSAAVDASGFFYAPDPASGKACSIGGNIAEGAGGPHCLKYGVTGNHVRSLTAVLPDGESLRLGGDIPDLPGYDLVGLFIGSEGILGICTQATLELLPKPEAVRTLLAVFDSIDAAGETVSAVIAAGIVPATLEMMDNFVIQAVEDSLAAGFPRDAAAVLLIEVDGLKEGVERQADEVKRHCEAGGASEVRVARSEAAREALWKGRRGAFGAISSLAPNYLVADGTVPRSRLPETLRRVRAIAERRALPAGNVFHAGDGNLHPLILFDSRDPVQTENVLQAATEMLEVCVELGGTVSGEHGIGTEKLSAMRLVFTEEEIEVQRLVKRALDPDDLFNPGKVLPPPVPGASVLRLDRTATSAPCGNDGSTGHDATPAWEPRERLVCTPEDIAEAARMAAADGVPLTIVGGGTRGSIGHPAPSGALSLRLDGLDARRALDPGSLVMRVEAGVSVASAREFAAEAGLLLPLDAGLPDRATIGGSISCNEQGPRRLRFGSVRDVILGVGVVLADGTRARFGGQTMKNVAGLDLTRLFIGSLGTLGVVTDAWVRLLPVPQAAAAIAIPVSGVGAAAELLAGADLPRLAPDIAQLLPVASSAALRELCVGEAEPHTLCVLLAFSGDEESVRRQVEEVRRRARTVKDVAFEAIGSAAAQQSLVDEVASFLHWARGDAVAARAQVPRSKTFAYLREIEVADEAAAVSFSVSAGLCDGVVHLAVHGDATEATAFLKASRGAAERLGGVLVVRGGRERLEHGFDPWGTIDAQLQVMRKIKGAFDPLDLLNPGRFVGGL